MRIGIFADTHDHMDHIRWIVAEFNRRECELAVFAGDLVSTFVIPPLRKLNCPLIASFGDNEGNKTGIVGGMEIIGIVGEPPFGFQTVDGIKILVTHQKELLKGQTEGADVIIFAHTHRPLIQRDDRNRLWVNPGEASGWTFNRPTMAILETSPLAAELIAVDVESESAG